MLKNIIVFLFFPLFSLLFISLGTSYADSTYDCGRAATSSTTNTDTDCAYGNRTGYHTVKGYYDTYAEAQAASAQGLNQLKATYPTYTYVFTSESHLIIYPSTQIWGVIRVGVNRCASSGTNWLYRWLYFYRLPTWLDTDLNCELDDITPDPELDEVNEPDCEYRKVLDVKDETSTVIATLITTRKGTEYWIGDAAYAEDCISGDNPANECIVKRYFEIGSTSWLPCSQLPSSGSGSPSANSTQNEIDLYPNLSINTQIEGVETGTATEVGDTDSEIFAKINDNITVTNDNLKVLGDKIAQIEGNTRQGIGGSGGGNDVIVQVDNQGNGVQSATGESDIAAIKQKVDNPQYDLSQDYDDQQLSDYEYDESDTESIDQGTIAEMLDSFLTRSPTSDFLEKISLTSSDPVCDFDTSFELFGKDIDLSFSFCDIESYLEFMGNLLFILCGISFIIIIFK